MRDTSRLRCIAAASSLLLLANGCRAPAHRPVATRQLADVIRSLAVVDAFHQGLLDECDERRDLNVHYEGSLGFEVHDGVQQSNESGRWVITDRPPMLRGMQPAVSVIFEFELTANSAATEVINLCVRGERLPVRLGRIGPDVARALKMSPEEFLRRAARRSVWPGSPRELKLSDD